MAVRGFAPKVVCPLRIAKPSVRTVVVPMAASKLYVGNLSWNATKEDLMQHFGKYGEVEDAFVALDRETGRSRGFGFVTLDEKAAADAIAGEDGQEFMGRSLRVNEAAPLGERPAGGGRGGRGGFRGGRGGGGRGYGGRDSYNRGGYGDREEGGGGYGGRGGGERRSYGNDY